MAAKTAEIANCSSDHPPAALLKARSAHTAGASSGSAGKGKDERSGLESHWLRLRRDALSSARMRIGRACFHSGDQG